MQSRSSLQNCVLVTSLLVVAMLPLNPAGAFSPLFNTRIDYGTGSSPYSVAIGDLNEDGHLDLAVANNSSNNVSVLLGNGGG